MGEKKKANRINSYEDSVWGPHPHNPGITRKGWCVVVQTGSPRQNDGAFEASLGYLAIMRVSKPKPKRKKTKAKDVWYSSGGVTARESPLPTHQSMKPPCCSAWQTHWLLFLKKYRNGKRVLQEWEQRSVRLMRWLPFSLVPISASLAGAFCSGEPLNGNARPKQHLRRYPD